MLSQDDCLRHLGNLYEREIAALSANGDTGLAEYLRSHSVLPSAILRQIHIVQRYLPHVGGRTLDWGCSHAPDATLLKLLGPALSQYLLEQRFQVNSVGVRVQPNSARSGLPLREKTVHLSTHALKSLLALHERLEPSPARDALARMLRRHGALKGR